MNKTYRLELSFSFDYPGPQITSDIDGKPYYQLTHQLYDDGTDLPVPFDPPDLKSHRFGPSDKVYVRLFSIDPGYLNEKLTPDALTFDAVPMSYPETLRGKTPFSSVLTTSRKTAQGTEITSFSIPWRHLSESLTRTGETSPSPCWILYPKDARLAPGDTKGSLLSFAFYTPPFGSTGAYLNTWQFQLRTSVSNGVNKLDFVFDPEMIVDPNT